MASQELWSQRLRDHCLARGLQEPAYTDLSDRRGGRTAWSTMVTINGNNFQARFWYDCAYLPNAKEDCAEIALRSLTGYTNTTQSPPPASHYRAVASRQDSAVNAG
ncbi:hypothetical protein AA0113_g8083 [Alternaria arborescens]|uniref:DRBM domain-containing protein n=1 Tax=Alternaria arborescens TaxID=156630 RepID=A0A4Q4RKE4_9PLEO|nr:hypothetical protein AA0112_g1611 [Alternaria arborescens]RYO57347.1 hypothetical protein AA0113_g8083 [Alternaria arborescens]